MRAQDILADDQQSLTRQGITIRKGTVGAFLANATICSDPASTPAMRQAALTDLADTLPALQALGFFQVLDVRDPALRRFVHRTLTAMQAGLSEAESPR